MPVLCGYGGKSIEKKFRKERQGKKENEENKYVFEKSAARQNDRGRICGSDSVRDACAASSHIGKGWCRGHSDRCTVLTPYQDDVLLNLTTCTLIIFGGLGFLVILDIGKQKCFKKLTLHSKVVIVTSLVLLVVGTLTLKLTENVTWLGAFFQSVSARTAGFSTYPIGQFTDAGLFVLCILMFIGASPGSTGGGIKTSTFFIMFQKIRGTCTKGTVHAFHRNISEQNISKAFMITILSGTVVCVATFFMCVLEPEYSFMQLLFEVVSAFGTVGLSTGITPALSVAGKAVIILVLFTGRVGAFTLISMWVNRTEPRARYSEEEVSIG